ALLAAQRRRVSASGEPRGPHLRWSGLRADAVSLPLRASSVDGLLLANEILADLPVTSGRNTGALELLGEIARVLAPGGAAVFAAPADEVRRRFPLLSRLLALELPELGSPRWPDAQAEGGFAQLFRALMLRKEWPIR